MEQTAHYDWFILNFMELKKEKDRTNVVYNECGKSTEYY